MSRILIVEDNYSIASGLRSAIELEGHDVAIESDGVTGLARARTWSPDLIVLDLMLPRLDGYQLLMTIRAERHDMPVLILSARSDEIEKVRGFRIGADDYVTKPFGLAELLARIEALLRRHVRVSDAEPAGLHIRVGALDVDAGSRTAMMNGNPVALRPKEFDLLWAIARRRGRVATRHELLHEVWGYASGVVSRTIDTHVVEVRRKLGAPPEAPEFILTVRKSGYRLAAQRDGAA